MIVVVGGGRRRASRAGPDRRGLALPRAGAAPAGAAASRSRAPRGSILDREGRELAVSVEATSVYAIPDDVENPRAAAQALAPLLGLTAREVLERLESEHGFVWIRRQIDAEAAARVLGAQAAPASTSSPSPSASIPKGHLASAVLGFVGTDDVGLAGLEHLYDRTIRGKPGEIVALTDARRSRYGEAETAQQPPGAGGRVARALARLGRAVRRRARARRRDASSTAPKSGSVVVLDPWNGEILAMASAPDFDPNEFARFPPDARRNRVIADSYEPGSTFKIVTGSLALDEGLVSLDETIDTGDGTIRVANTTIQEADHHRYGALTLGGIFEHSSNIGIIRVGLRLGARRLYDGATAFGVGQPTGVDLPGREHRDLPAARRAGRRSRTPRSRWGRRFR